MLINKTCEGRHQLFEDLVFHGGRGSTLEMRVFSKTSLIGAIKNAGFSEVKVHCDCLPEFGVLFDKDEPSQILSLRKP